MRVAEFFDRKPMDADRVEWAFIGAPVAASLAVGLVFTVLSAPTDDSWPSMAFIAFMTALIVSIPLVIVVALPLYALLRSRVPARWWTGGLAGAAVGSAPCVLVIMARSELPTWMTALIDVAWTAPFGFVGGVVFWWLAAWQPRRGCSV
ncbi:MAG: hypothetical protein E7812_02990 [Phenylobacterium sp.]|nr:MAG: hypothetical protein E7812_02990 [Phenylobacterium sp.]